MQKIVYKCDYTFMVMVFEWVICKPKNKFKNQGERTNNVFFSQKLANYGKNNAIQSGF